MLCAAMALAITAQVQATSTPIGEPELAAVLRDAHYAVVHRFPSRHRLVSSTTHVMFETGRGAASKCHNLGAIGAIKGPFFRIAGHRLMAFEDFIDAGKAYWRTVPKCTSAVQAFDEERLTDASASLARCGYHRTKTDVYARGLTGLVGVAWRAVDKL